VPRKSFARRGWMRGGGRTELADAAAARLRDGFVVLPGYLQDPELQGHRDCRAAFGPVQRTRQSQAR